MSKYDIKYKCGHEDRVDFQGPVKDREWKAAREAEKLCPECYQKVLKEKRTLENAASAEANKEAGLPPLAGSESQIAWAESIRKEILSRAQEAVEKAKETEKEKLQAGFKSLRSRAIAPWWIDKRYVYDIKELLLEESKAAEDEGNLPPIQIIEEAKLEATVRPSKPKTETIAEIAIEDKKVKVHFSEKREDFRDILKSLGYFWKDGKWVRILEDINGAPEDRGAQAGHELLAAGFIIRIFDEKVREMAVNGNYIAEQTRWVQGSLKENYTGWFFISWDRNREDCYKAARKIPGSKWVSPYVVVPSEQFEEVIDFAQRYDFKLTRQANDIADAAREAKERVLLADVSAPKKRKREVIQTNPPILEVPKEVSVDEELLDKD